MRPRRRRDRAPAAARGWRCHTTKSTRRAHHRRHVLGEFGRIIAPARSCPLRRGSSRACTTSARSVDDGVDDADQQGHRQHDLAVGGEDRLHRIAADAGPVEDRLDHDGAGNQAAEQADRSGSSPPSPSCAARDSRSAPRGGSPARARRRRKSCCRVSSTPARVKRAMVARPPRHVKAGRTRWRRAAVKTSRRPATRLSISKKPGDERWRGVAGARGGRGAATSRTPSRTGVETMANQKAAIAIPRTERTEQVSGQGLW